MSYSRYEEILCWIGFAIAVAAVLASIWLTATVLSELERPTELPSVLVIGAVAGLLASMTHDLLQSFLPRRA